jgi:hypothetical protein
MRATAATRRHGARGKCRTQRTGCRTQRKKNVAQGNGFLVKAPGQGTPRLANLSLVECSTTDLARFRPRRPDRFRWPPIRPERGARPGVSRLVAPVMAGGSPHWPVDGPRTDRPDPARPTRPDRGSGGSEGRTGPLRCPRQPSGGLTGRGPVFYSRVALRGPGPTKRTGPGRHRPPGRGSDPQNAARCRPQIRPAPNPRLGPRHPGRWRPNHGPGVRARP